MNAVDENSDGSSGSHAHTPKGTESCQSEQKSSGLEIRDDAKRLLAASNGEQLEAQSDIGGGRKSHGSREDDISNMLDFVHLSRREFDMAKSTLL